MNEELSPSQEIPQQIPEVDINSTQNLVEPVVIPTSPVVEATPPVIPMVSVDIVSEKEAGVEKPPENEPIQDSMTPVDLENAITQVSVVPVVATTPMPTKSKSMVKYVVFLIILWLLIVLGYRSYSNTTISYTATIPVWFFDDKERIVVKNDQYKQLNAFISGPYQDLLKNTSIQYSDNMMSGFDQALISWDREYIVNNKQTLIDLEKIYMQNNFFNKLYQILSTWERWHIDPNTPFLQIPKDYLSSSKDLIRDISLFMILRCTIEEKENRCSWYQLLSKALVAKTQRKSWYIGDLIHWNIQKYLIQQEKISHTGLDLCKDLGNPKQITQDVLKDEYNVVFKSMINDTANEVIKSLENNGKISERVPKFVFRAINKDTLFKEIKSQAEYKWQQRFYNLIQWNDNRKFAETISILPITKMILATLWIAPNNLLWDVLSDEIVSQSVPLENKITSKYKTLSNLCNTK